MISFFIGEPTCVGCDTMDTTVMNLGLPEASELLHTVADESDLNTNARRCRSNAAKIEASVQEEIPPT